MKPRYAAVSVAERRLARTVIDAPAELLVVVRRKAERCRVVRVGKPLLGIALAASSAAVLNHVLDRHIDSNASG